MLHDMGNPSYAGADIGSGAERWLHESQCLAQQCCSAANPGDRQKMQTFHVSVSMQAALGSRHTP